MTPRGRPAGLPLWPVLKRVAFGGLRYPTSLSSASSGGSSQSVICQFPEATGHFVAGGAIGTMHCRVFDSLGDHKLAAGGRDQKGRHLFNKGRAAWCDEG